MRYVLILILALMITGCSTVCKPFVNGYTPDASGNIACVGKILQAGVMP